MKRLILSLGILISALTSNVVMAQSSPCLNDVTAPDTNWTAGNVGRTSANPMIIKLNPAGYAAIVADSGNGQAGVNLAKVFVPSQFTLANSAYTVVSALDDCANTYTGSLAAKWPKFTISKGAFTCSDVSASSTTPIAVTFNVFDANNNVRTGTLYVKVVEQVDPSLVTKNVTVTLDATGSATIAEGDVVQSKSDNCGTPTVTLSQSVFTCDDLGSNTIQVTATDAAGNDVVQNATVTVLDETTPVVTLQAATIYLDAAGSASLVDNDVIAAIVEACDQNPVVTITPNTFDCTDKGSNTVTITVTDASGNQFSGTTTVVVLDNLAPVVTTQDITVSLDATGFVSIDAEDVVVSGSDNCDVPTYSVGPNSWSCNDLGARLVTFTATDASGNVYTTTVTVTVVDDLDPSLSTQNVTLSLDANGNATLTEAAAVVSKGDNCGAPVITFSQSSFDCTEVGTVSVDVTATDASNNTTVKTITVTIEDNIDPTVTLLSGPFSFNVDSNGSLTVSTSDFVDATSDNCGVASVTVSPTSFDCTNLGSNTVTITVTDDNGNVTTTTTSVTISDTEAPVFVAGSALATGTWDYSYTSGSKLWISGSQPFTRLQLDLPSGNGYAQVGTGFNAAGITPYKAFKGTSGGPGRKVAMVYNAGLDTVFVTYTNRSASPNFISTSDTCIGLRKDSDDFLIAATSASGSVLYEFTSPVNNLVYGDYAINNSVRIVKVSLDAPVITVVAANDYPGFPCSYNPSASYTLVDNTVPGVGGFETTVVLGANGTGSFDVNAEFGSSVSDNCAVASLVASQSTFDCSDLGTNDVVMTATDASGNISMDTVTVTVEDNTAPFLTQLTYDRNLRNGFALLTVQEVLSAIASDNCVVDYATSALSREYFDCNDVGNNTVTASIRDMAGNFSFVNFTVIIHDTILPVANAVPSYTVYLDANGAATVSAADVDNGSSDDCGNFTLSLSQTSFDCDDLGSNTVTFTISDEEVNSATTSVTIVVKDTINPVWNFVASSPASCDVIVDDYAAMGELRVKDSTGLLIPLVGMSQSSDYAGNCNSTQISSLTDNDFATGPGADSELGAYIQVDLGSVQLVSSLEIGALDGTCSWGTSYTDNLFVYGSTDGANFTYLLDLSGTSETALTTFTLPSASSVRYLKFSVNASGLAPVNGVCVTEVADYVGLGEVQVIDANGNVPLVSLVASSIWDAVGWPGCTPAQSIGSVTDNDPATGVGTMDDLGANVVFDFGGLYDVTSIKLMPITGCSWDEEDFDGDQVFVSADNSDWFHIGTLIGSTNGSFTTLNDTLTFPVRYLKVLAATVAAAQGGSGGNSEPEVVLYLDANGTASLDASTVYSSYVTDNCDFVVTSNKSTFSCADKGDVSVILTATDDAGNSSDYTVTVSVLDTLSPSVNIASTFDLFLDANGQATLEFVDIDNGTADNCTQFADLSVDFSKTSFDCGNIAPPVAPGGQPYTVYVTVTDLEGNDRTVSLVVTVRDTLSPVASVDTVSYTAVLDNNGAFALGVADITPSLVSFADNCGVDNIFFAVGSNLNYDCDDAGNTITVTLVAVDEAGNETEVVVNVTVEDQDAPVWNVGVPVVMSGLPPVLGPTATVSLDANGQATLNAQLAFASYVTDNCDFKVTSSVVDFDCLDAENSPIEVMLTATDSSGNSSTQIAYITVEDNISPTQIVLSTYTATLDANGSVTVDFSDVDNGSFDNCAFKAVPSSWTYDCDDIGSVLLTGSLIDSSGNSTPFSVNVTVEDKSVPVFDPSFVPANVTVYSVQYDCFGLVNVDSDPLPAVTDNCDINVDIERHWAGKIASGIIPMPVGLHTLWAVATDDYGNTDSTAYAYVQVIDTTLPDATFWNNVTVVLGSNGTANITPATIIDASYDNCGIANVSIVPSVVDCDDLGGGFVSSPAGGIGYVTLTVTLVDFNGNTRTYNPMVAVEDQSAPTFVPLAGAATVSLSAAGTASVVWSDLVSSVTDNCSVETVTLSQSSFNCTDVGVNNIVITATDASGNIATYTAVLNVVDDMNPVFATKNITLALNNSGNATIVPSDVIDGSASDNCSNTFTYSLSKSFFDCTNVGVNTVNVSVVDMAGNTTTLSATVTIVDDIDPTLTLSNGLVTVALDANGQATLGVSEVVGLAADNCSIQSVVLSQTAFDCSDLGNGTVTVTATDVNGNTTTATQNIVVVDLVAPVVTVKSTATVKQLDAAGAAVISQTDILTAVTDNCTASPSVVWSPTSVSCAQVGPVTVSITVTDASGNVTTTTKVIQVVDELAPSLATKSYTAVLNANGNATIVESNVVDTKSDNCGVPAVSLSKTVFDCTNKGLNNVLVTATDVNGNSTTEVAVVTVVDQTAPSMVLAGSLTVSLNGAGTATISVPDVVTSAEDNCDVPTVTLSKYTYTCADMPSTSITVTAVDAAGNSTVETFTVNVVDALAPVITTKSTATTIALDANGSAPVVFADVLSSVVDNCTASPTITWFPTTVSCEQVGSVTVSITTTDASGNVSVASKVIQVVDNINPTLVTKAYTAVLNANGNATVVESNVVQSKSDNCGVPSVLMSKTVFDCTDKGANNVTVTATDANGNVTTQTAVVTVVDQTAPFFTTAPSLTLLLNASGVATVSVPDVVTSSGDNCDVPTVTLSKYTFTCADMPSTSITVTAVDASGNTTTGTYTVNVLDQLAPVITPKATPTTIALDATGNAAVTLADVMGVALDNCTASPVVTWFPTSVSCAQVGPVTVTITAVDASGNVSNATKVIQIIDNIAPTVVLNGNSLVTYTLPLNASGNATLTVPNVVNSATDNCGTPVVSLSKTAFDCSNLGDNVVVVTSVDQFGNVKSTNAIVKVVDVTAPSIVTPSTQVVLNLSANGTATLPLNQVMLSTADNCGTPTVTWTPSTFSCANLGNNTVTITSTDASGNVSTATVVVLVQDVTAPVIATVSGVVTKVLGTNGTVAINQSDVVASVSDACDNASTVTWTPTTVSCANVGNVAVIITAVDASGNISTSVKTVLVVDQTAPVISSPASITLNLNAAGTVTLPAGVASATDNCAVNGIQYSKSLFDCTNLGANTVTITATDAHGNVATSTMTVNVVDNTAPSLTLVGSPMTVALNAAGTASVNAAQLVANANDNCAIASYTVTPNTFNCSNLGGNTVTVTATDASGNATSQTVTVNVVDVTGPSIVVNPAAVTVTLNASGVGSITNAQVVSSVSDNCTSAPSVVVTPNVFTCADLGQQMVTIFATDAAGNISTTTKLITVVDAAAPVIVSAPQNVTLPGCNGNYTYAYQVTDNCGYTATLVSGLASGTQFPVGTTTVTWSFADASGNTTTHSFNVTVLPLGTYTLPAVNEYCAGHEHFDLTSGQAGLVFYGSSVFNNGTTFYTEVPGTYALNFVFTDANGCTQNGTFNLIVRPRPVKPSIVQVAATTLESSVTGATYQWYRNEQLIVGAKNKQYVFTAGGKYEVVVFNAYGCGTMSEGFVINANGLSVEEIITSVRLFPNPTSSSVTLETSFEAAEDLQVTLVDMVGSVVYRETLNKGNNQHVLDMSGLAAGTYNVILTNANGASSNVQRVVKID